MSLPDLIEIVPLTEPVQAVITVPGSKSITNRALVLAALAEGEVTLHGALWSEDTQVMVDCLQDLGYMVNVAPDEKEFCNRTVTVYGMGGRVPRGGTTDQPLDLFVGNAGTAARFLSALVCLGDGVYRLHGIDRMHERPQAALFSSLRELGYQIDSENDRLPALIHGAGPKPGAACTVSIEESSQFASALTLAGRVGRWKISITGENAEESPYVRMTSELIKVFPNQSGEFAIEPDASSGSYFWAAGDVSDTNIQTEDIPGIRSAEHAFSVQVRNWPPVNGWQIDARFVSVLPRIASVTAVYGRNQRLLYEEMIDSDGERWMTQPDVRARVSQRMQPVEVSRRDELGDSIMTAIVMSPLSLSRCVFTDLGRLRVQECERVVALATELTKCGAKVIEKGDTLTVSPAELHGADIETYNDHRMAMCFGILGLKVPGIRIRNPSCVKKTFPNFWQKLAVKPPDGLGATILDANTLKELSHEELFAD